MNYLYSSLEQYFADNKSNLDQCITGTKWTLNKFKQVQPKIYMEIGAAALNNFALYEALLPSNGLAIALDFAPNGAHYGEGWKNYISYSGCETLLLDSSSIDELAVDKVKRALAGRTIDWLFLDGDHHYPFVSREWELWSPLVTKPGGIITMHDVDLESGLRVANHPTHEDLPIETGGHGTGAMYYLLKQQGYNVSLVPETSIGTALVQL